MLLFERDLELVLASVNRVITLNEGKTINLVEIGVNRGGTAEQVVKELVIKNAQFFYYGIDPVDYPDRFKHTIFINKPSQQAINDIPLRLDWVFVDGCHCPKCVIGDFALYGSRLNVGGELCFHDASPSTQGRDPQDYPFMNDIHDIEIAKKGIAVRDVLDNIVKRNKMFELIQPSFDQEYGGVEVYRRK